MTTTMQIANGLEKQYTDLNFKNHCYLRIAYDNAVSGKWDTLVNRPFTKNASTFYIHEANLFLCSYITNKNLLLQHNKISLEYRKIK